MDDVTLTFLNDKFNMYYDAAKSAEQRKDYAFAKRNYLLAAETLMQMAKLSTPQLKKARMDRARRLVELAENAGSEQPVKAEKGQKAGQPDGEQSEGREWVASQKPDVHFSDIAGLDDVKMAITTRMINPLKYPEKYALYKKKTGGGVLLYGPPGTGKTMIAKAIACEVGATFFAVKGSDIVSKWVGDSEKNINSLFETARKEKLAIIFIDEMDSLIGKRGVDTHNDKRVNEFLQQMDGFVGKNPNLLLLGATNRPWDIDGAAMRSGRFSQKIYVPLPDAKARKFLFEKALKGVPLDADVSIDALVEQSEGYSGADIEELCDRAKEIPVYKSIRTDKTVNITTKDFANAFSQVPPTVGAAEVQAFEKYANANSRTVKAEDLDDIPDIKNTDTKPTDTLAKQGVSPEDKVLEQADDDDSPYKFEWDNLPAITFEDVAGLDDVKETIKVKVLLPLSHPDAFEGYEKKSGGGLFLYGPPGTGKTMIGAAIANEIGAKFCSVKPSDLLYQGVGNSEKAVRSLFTQARKFPCAVIYFDEMDSITPKETRSQYAKQLRSELLSQLQGIEAYSGKKKNILFLIAATNKPWDVDSAFLRPGRFGIPVYIGLPDEASREYMINKRLTKIESRGIVSVHDDVNVAKVVEKTNGFNGSDITGLLDKVEEISVMRGIRSGEKYICGEDFEVALQSVSSSVQKADIVKLKEWKEKTLI